MASNCIDAKISDGNLHEGLRILARIIARDFITKNTLICVSSDNRKPAEQKET